MHTHCPSMLLREIECNGVSNRKQRLEGCTCGSICAVVHGPVLFAIILLLVGKALLGTPRWHRKLQKVVTRPFVYSDFPEETPQASSSTWDPANDKDCCNVSGQCASCNDSDELLPNTDST
jgi:hypothetical protein